MKFMSSWTRSTGTAMDNLLRVSKNRKLLSESVKQPPCPCLITGLTLSLKVAFQIKEALKKTSSGIKREGIKMSVKRCEKIALLRIFSCSLLHHLKE